MYGVSEADGYYPAPQDIQSVVDVFSSLFGPSLLKKGRASIAVCSGSGLSTWHISIIVPPSSPVSKQVRCILSFLRSGSKVKEHRGGLH